MEEAKSKLAVAEDNLAKAQQAHDDYISSGFIAPTEFFGTSLEYEAILSNNLDRLNSLVEAYLRASKSNLSPLTLNVKLIFNNLHS